MQQTFLYVYFAHLSNWQEFDRFKLRSCQVFGKHLFEIILIFKIVDITEIVVYLIFTPVKVTEI